VAIQDKGPGKGAVLVVERILTDRDSGKRLATLTATSYCRGDGGFGGPTDDLPPPHQVLPTPAQFTVDLPTIPQAALLYRLHGDPTPLHADPDYASRVGFRQPIMHGLCTFGMACHAVLKSAAYPDPASLQKIEARFKEPVYPGETLRADLWKADKVISFRLTVPTRNNAVVLDNGRAELST
jgi:acyl dehydratase